MMFRYILYFIVLGMLSSCVTEKSALLSVPNNDLSARAGNHIELAAGYLKIDRYDVAYSEIQKAIEIEPENFRAHHVAASISMNLGRQDDAEKSFRKALSYKADSAVTAHELGVLLCNTGRKTEGVSYLAQAMGNRFFNQRSFSALRAGECLGKNNPSQARSYFKKAYSINPKLDVALYRTAEVLYLEGYALQARGYYERFMQSRKQTSQTLLLGYRIEKKANASSQADLYAQKLLREFPKSPEAVKIKKLVSEDS